jgi:competence protein ComEC
MLLELVPVKEIILSPDSDMEEGRLPAIEAAAARHGTRVTRLNENTERAIGSLQLTLFAPPPNGRENERCIISLASIEDFDMLMMGDSLKEAELELAETGVLPDTELLIVGHHGSKTSSDDLFLETVRAENAVISVGNHNSYGHPAREVLARLQAHGSNIYRTDRNGTVEIRVNQH